MLRVDRIRVCYDDIPALHEVSFEIEEGQIVSIVGSNGAGKSTILKTISGLLHPVAGQIEFAGTRIDRSPPYEIVRMGIAHVPEGRRIFSRLSVVENLYLGAYTRKSDEEKAETLEQIFRLFPILEERRNQRAGTLSGGEQQMLAIARALMSRPKLLMLDEPSLGLMPILVSKVFDTLKQIHEEGITILLVEQNVREALELADRAYVLMTGNIVLQGTGEELLETDLVRQAYLGM
ncbi:MAG: branched-chain amino acid ABC transporter ATP-binding protein [Chloroflexi bacterium]|nr:MAG: branched-chain amino acid ABC transporter ATP-binding protein [Chloroflexota bacterium]RLC91109.1 MAG: branched-chain amino acid ABC transporter ATP-binding protein [Chloroflexota bacterium]